MKRSAHFCLRRVLFGGPALLFLSLVACHPRPVEDLVLADVAVKAAQKVKADTLAPDAFRRAENYYLRAKKDYNEGYFDSSRKYAKEARMLAEQAEYKSLLKQSQLKNKTTLPSDEEAGAGPGNGAGPGSAPPDPGGMPSGAPPMPGAPTMPGADGGGMPPTPNR